MVSDNCPKCHGEMAPRLGNQTEGQLVCLRCGWVLRPSTAIGLFATKVEAPVVTARRVADNL